MNCDKLYIILTIVFTNYVISYPINNAVQKKRSFCNDLPGNLSDTCDFLAAPQKFCGPVLSNTLDELCKSNFLGPDDDQSIFPKFTKSRMKRQAYDECCTTPCSKSHLIYYYCSEPGTIFSNHLKNISSEALETLSNFRNTIKINGKKLPMEHRPQGDGNNFSEQVRKIKKHKRKRKIKKRKRKCGCKRGKRKQRGKIIKYYRPHRIGQVTRDTQPIILGNNDRAPQLPPVASDNNIAKENWSNTRQ